MIKLAMISSFKRSRSDVARRDGRQIDVLVIGAGAAGLTAARELTAGGLTVTVLEGRSRVGGRIFTRHLPSMPFPIELGAEFVHGEPPEIFDVVRTAKLGARRVAGDPWCRHGGPLGRCADLYGQTRQLFERMSVKGGDRSFQDFIDRDARDVSQAVRQRAIAYVEGFNAADARRISLASLIGSRDADRSIHADAQYRIAGGYDRIVEWLARPAAERRPDLRLRAVVRAVRWRRGRVEVATEAGEVFRAERAIVTLPLGVLRAAPSEPAAVRFVPEIAAKRRALQGMEMGSVIRVTLVFRERFWERMTRDRRALRNLGFLFTDHRLFPTWWSTLPAREPVLTAWAAGRRADELSFHAKATVTRHALAALAEALDIDERRLRSLLRAAHTHDWQADRFSRGAYSWAVVGGANASAELAEPLDRTLFFAGEATDVTGHYGTVHGAIASGKRAAAQILSG